MADKYQDVCQKTKESANLYRDLAGYSGIDECHIMTLEICILTALSTLLHLFFKRFNQPSMVSQTFAGLLVGRTCLRRLISSKYVAEDNDHFISMVSVAGAFYMFLFGLEMDFQFLLRSIRAASSITVGNIASSTIIASVIGPIMYGSTGTSDGRLLFVFILTIILATSASPVLIHMMAELKMTMSEVGRLGISTASINDATRLVILAVVIFFPMPNEQKRPGEKFMEGTIAVISILVSAMFLRVFVLSINRKSKKHHSTDHDGYLWILLISLMTLLAILENLEYQTIMLAYAMGVAFPRDGQAIRTISDDVAIRVNYFVLPVCFGYAGVQTNLFMLRDKTVFITVVIIVILGTVGKIISTSVVARHLKMQMKKGVVLGILLNVKGPVDLIIITLGRKYEIFGEEIYQALLISMIFNNMITNPIASYLVGNERHHIKQKSVGLEFLNLDQELRILFCVHSRYNIPTLLSLIKISAASNCTPYLLHLIECTDPIPTQPNDERRQDDDNLNGGRDARLVSACADAFKKETGIHLRQLTDISSLANLHKDACDRAEDLHTAMIVVPYSRLPRFDGAIGPGIIGVRDFNANVLRCATCTVGILVDRRWKCFPVGEERKPRVMVVFLGGADDREAVAYGTRLAMQSSVAVTVVRFLLAKGRGNCDSDEEFMADIHKRFVSTRTITYVEKIVEKSSELVNEIISMERKYSLFIVGRQRQGPTSMLTVGITESEHCQELGVIGYLLASSKFMSGLVLVIQQYCKSRANI